MWKKKRVSEECNDGLNTKFSVEKFLCKPSYVIAEVKKWRGTWMWETESETSRMAFLPPIMSVELKPWLVHWTKSVVLPHFHYYTIKGRIRNSSDPCKGERMHTKTITILSFYGTDQVPKIFFLLSVYLVLEGFYGIDWDRISSRGQLVVYVLTRVDSDLIGCRNSSQGRLNIWVHII